ncbi:MAG TPA: GMC family oxidoreductase [Dongiaceae bacterium]|nr:GMC family oxidoreductase [Dongiaceae bacterium]
MNTDDVVSALAYSFAQPHAEPGRLDLQAPYNDLARFMLCQQGNLPDYLRTPMRAATLGFDLAGLLLAGQPFHSQPPASRRRQVEAWKDSRLAFRRDLMLYYESLATLALYSRQAEDSGLRPSDFGFPGPASPAPIPQADGVISVPARELRCAIAVVGSGPGGAITACVLAEAGRDVLLIEEGPFCPLESCPPFSKSEMLRKYRNGGQTVALGANKVAYVEGCCVGGGSEINSGLYHRAPPEILEVWRRQFKVSALSEADLRPHFEACERELSVSLLPGAAPAASLKLHQGASRLGWKSFEVPRWFRQGPGKPPGGERQSMTRTFVPRLLAAGGKLLPQTRIQRLRRQAGQWLLEGRHADTGALRIEAETLFLCGGAVQTPALLRRSGITRNVGNALQVHPTVKIVARFPDPVNAADMGVPVHQVKEFAPRLSFGCSISSPPYLALGMIDHPSCASEVRQAWTCMANYYVMLAGQGSGTVRPLPGFRDPLVRYRLSEQDRRHLAEGLRKLAEVLFAGGALALYPGLVRGPRLLSPDDLRQLPEILPNGLARLVTVHLFSSCPMGEDLNRCATDSFGRVHGFPNLVVNDASLLCTAPGVNPQGSIMALARRNAIHFLGRRPNLVAPTTGCG